MPTVMASAINTPVAAPGATPPPLFKSALGSIWGLPAFNIFRGQIIFRHIRSSMSFAIEAPGEAAPLSLHELFRVLQAASSHDNSQRQSAGKQLSVWESIPDYYPGLQVCEDLANIPNFCAVTWICGLCFLRGSLRLSSPSQSTNYRVPLAHRFS